MAPGMFEMVALAVVLGFAFNAMNPHGLPLIRKPLRETRRFAAKSSLARPISENQPVADAQPLHEPISKTIVAVSKPVTRKSQPVASVHKNIVPKPAAKKPAGPLKKTVQALFTTLDDAKVLFDNKSAIFIDARPEEDYEAEHITRAISLFVDDLNGLYRKTLGNVPSNKTIVTYCSDPECDGAIRLADALVAKGHTHVVILLDGLPGWKDAGYPTEVGPN